MSTHKGSRSCITDHKAARLAWERIWGKSKERQWPEPKVEWITWTIPNLPKIGECVWPEWYCEEIVIGDGSTRIKVQRYPFIGESANSPQHVGLGEANDKQ